MWDAQPILTTSEPKSRRQFFPLVWQSRLGCVSNQDSPRGHRCLETPCAAGQARQNGYSRRNRGAGESNAGTFWVPREGQCMAEMALAELAAYGVEWPPTEDELPCDDGMPMGTHRSAMYPAICSPTRRRGWVDSIDGATHRLAQRVVAYAVEVSSASTAGVGRSGIKRPPADHPRGCGGEACHNTSAASQ